MGVLGKMEKEMGISKKRGPGSMGGSEIERVF